MNHGGARENDQEMRVHLIRPWHTSKQTRGWNMWSQRETLQRSRIPTELTPTLWRPGDKSAEPHRPGTRYLPKPEIQPGKLLAMRWVGPTGLRFESAHTNNWASLWGILVTVPHGWGPEGLTWLWTWTGPLRAGNKGRRIPLRQHKRETAIIKT